MNLFARTLDGGLVVKFSPDSSALGAWAASPNETTLWREVDSMLQKNYDDHTGIGVTAPVAFSPDGSQFIYGTYEGTAVAARLSSAKKTVAGNQKIAGPEGPAEGDY